jgi:putative ABC transport system permease protein
LNTSSDQPTIDDAMELLRNARLALRGLMKARGYACAAVFTLALVVSANATMFSAVYAVLLRPLPIRQPEELIVGWGSDQAQHLAVVELSYRNFEEWTTGSASFVQAAAMGSSTWPAVLDSPDGSTRLSSAGVSASFFDTVGVVPVLGRGFRTDDDLPGAPRVVVLSHRLWTTRFGADPRVVGTTIALTQPHTVVGVMPEGFDFPRGTDFWTPVVPILAGSGGEWRTDALSSVGVLFVIGRLRPGVTPRMAQDELDSRARRLEQRGSSPRFGSAVVVTPFQEYTFGAARPALWALLAAVGVLLLIGCANVSGLMLTRLSLRRREHAVRLALGAVGRTLASLWVAETLILSIAGGAVGLFASAWIAKLMVALAPDDIPRLTEASMNVPVALFTGGVLFIAALVCGAGPVHHATAANVIEALHDDARSGMSRHTRRSRSLLLVLQIALSVVLLVAAGLVVRSFANLRAIDLGFVPSQVVTMTVAPRNPSRPPNQWMDDLLRRLSGLPEVDAAGAVFLRPLALGPIGQDTTVVLEGQPDTPQAERQNPALNYQVATPGYFSAMRIALKRGRLFNAQDSARSTPVALLSVSAARRLWPGRDPVGKRLLLPTFKPDGPSKAWRTVVGVVSDVRYRGIDDARLDVYDAASQSPMAANDVVVRTSGDVRRVAAAVQAEARRLDPRVVIDRLTTMEAIVARAVGPWRFSVWMFTVFAGLALVLAAVGLFSVVSLDVAQRRREFAVRFALGGRRKDVVQPLLAEAGRRLLIGLTLGIVTSLVASQMLRGLLVGVERVDATTYALVITLLAAVVIVAAGVPAWRAASIDPSSVLKRD